MPGGTDLHFPRKYNQVVKEWFSAALHSRWFGRQIKKSDKDEKCNTLI